MHNPWDKVAFRRLLRRIMSDAGLSQLDVAEMAGISRPQVSRWVGGEHRPGFDAISRLAAAVSQQHPELASEATGMLLAAGYPPPAQVVTPPPGEAPPGSAHQPGPRPPELRYDDPAKDSIAADVWRKNHDEQGTVFTVDVLRGVVAYLWRERQQETPAPSEPGNARSAAAG